MLSVETRKKASLHELKSADYGDFKRVLDLYDRWDMAARDKDFHNAEHYEYRIKKIHDKHGIAET